jgi:dipeptidyl aminopeptidase/acylaminoacyl peptidase
VSLPTFSSDPSLRWSSTPEEYAAALADGRFRMEEFSYSSDGLTVGAYLYHPVEPGQGRRPVIVYNRGSFTRPEGFAGEILVMARRYGLGGFTVVAPHYRGSNGWAGRDEMGGADLHDLFHIVPELKRIEGVDPTRVFLAGESRGGMMTYAALRDGFPARAAAVWGAFTDLGPLLESGPQAKYAPMIWPDLATRREEIVATRSAIRWAERIHAPLLILHGEADEDIPVDQARRMDAELTRLGKVHTLQVFPDQGHRISGRAAERDAAVIAWFQERAGD